jgi:prepilin-type processing-associated H-X9-DG protein
MLEIVVAVGVIGLLLAVIIPAVQSVHETSRRATCAARLREIGAGLHFYEATRGIYPDAYRWREELLPFLDQGAFAETISSRNFAVSLTGQRIPTFICPADSQSDGAFSQANFVGNYGTGLQTYGFNGFMSPLPGGPHNEGPWGVPHRRGPNRVKDIRDGLSNTAAASEALISQHPGSVSDRRRAVWDLSGISLTLFLPDRLAEVRQYCLAINPATSTPLNFDRGWNVFGRWDPPTRVLPGSPISWGYDHALSPNAPPCTVGSTWGTLPASSNHNHGVNVLFGDGRVEFISDSIDDRVWNSIGDCSSGIR